MLDNIISFFAAKDAFTRIVVAIIIIIIGTIIANIVSKIILHIRLRSLRAKKIKLDPISRTGRDIIYVMTLMIALMVLNSGFDDMEINQYLSIVPIVLSFLFILVIAILISNILYVISKRITIVTGLKQYFVANEMFGLYKVLMLSYRAFLYLFLFFISLNFAIPGYETFTSFMNSLFFYLIIILMIVLAYSSRRILQNLMSGIYLLISNEYRLGQEIIYKGTRGHIIKIGYIKTLIETDDSYELVIPNSALVSERFLKKSVSIELETLEKIKNNFIAQEPSHCGPASAEIILNIFGYKITQQEIGKLCNTRKGYGTHPDDLIRVVQKLTRNKVKARWVDAEGITDLRTEIGQWLSDDALIIADFYKKALFADAKAGHYVVVVAVEGNELVVLDPSSKKGGVYLVDSDKMYRAMDTHSWVIEGKRGYIVMAPKGSTAYYRIERNLIHPGTNIYNEIKKKFQKELERISKQSKRVTRFVPASIMDFFDKYKDRDQISRVWTPSMGKKKMKK
jgi:small-conductance mechanosensitive channel/predicted double-glycine peptidase